MSTRTLRARHAALREDIADLVTRRPLPAPGLEQVDPFLFLNHHGPQIYAPGNHGLPFGPHPHRGFETVTFIVDGELMHRDSAGHESVIGSRGVQWMTAGRGLVHAELSPDEFKRHGGALEILQLWVNLPARLKMTAPRYIGLQRDDIPVIAQDDGRVTVRLVSGALDGHEGPIRSLTDVHLMLVELSARGRVRLPAPRERNVLLHVVRGTVTIAGERVDAFELAELDHNGDNVDVGCAGDGIVLFGHAEPIGEPVVSYGPFVMNTREEIAQAIRDYQAGRFGDAQRA
jgi:redox-sensitive bicupin YhaK (pirin superfamily)